MEVNWKALFLSLHGRIGRGPFWIGFAIVFAATIFLPFVPVVGPLLVFLVIWPQIALQAKRLHDMGRSAWLMLIPPSVIIMSFVLGALIGGPELLAQMVQKDSQGLATSSKGTTWLLLLIALPAVVFFAYGAWLGLGRGNPDDNAFGPPPKPLR